MVTAPASYIEVGDYIESAVIAGTGLKVSVIAPMYVYRQATLEWILETYELTPAQVYAAVSYYYDHQEAIDRHNREADEWAEEVGISTEMLRQRLAAKRSANPDSASE